MDMEVKTRVQAESNQPGQSRVPKNYPCKVWNPYRGDQRMEAPDLWYDQYPIPGLDMELNHLKRLSER